MNAKQLLGLFTEARGPGNGLPVPGRRSFRAGLSARVFDRLFLCWCVRTGRGTSTSFGDLTIWGVVSLILAVLSYFGWREKRKRRHEEAARVV